MNLGTVYSALVIFLNSSAMLPSSNGKANESTAGGHHEKQHANRPDIGLRPIVAFILEYLWGHVVDCPADGVHAFVRYVVGENDREAKISEFGLECGRVD